MARKTDAEREAEITAIKATFDAAVLGLNDDKRWVELVETIADFGAKYSFGNQLLILAQAAERGFNPQMVMSLRAWNKRGRSVIKGSKSLRVWAPCSYRISKDEADKRAAKGQRAYDGNGNPVREVRGFRLEPVFDISQTDGDEVELPPSIVRRWRSYQGPGCELLTGDDTGDALGLVIREIEHRGYEFTLVSPAELGHANGDTNPATKVVRVRNDVSPLQTLKTSVHELAHIVTDHVADLAEYRQHRGRMETEAESIAHIVLKVLGMDTEAYSTPYVASWSQGKAEILEAAAKAVVEGARTILRALEPPAEQVEQDPAEAAEVAA